jgi:hypothetical protein
MILHFVSLVDFDLGEIVGDEMLRPKKDYE